MINFFEKHGADILLGILFIGFVLIMLLYDVPLQAARDIIEWFSK